MTHLWRQLDIKFVKNKKIEMEETESSSEIEEIGEISSPNPGNDQEHILEEPESLIRRLKEESR